MGIERIFHLICARLENTEQVSVPAFEIVEDIAQLLFGSPAIELQHPIDDVVGPGFIGRIEIARFSRRLERLDDYSGWIRA